MRTRYNASTGDNCKAWDGGGLPVAANHGSDFHLLLSRCSGLNLVPLVDEP